MEYLIAFLFGKAYKAGEGHARLKALSDAKSQKQTSLIPLEPLSNFLDVMFQFGLAIGLVVFVSALYLAYEDGMSSTHVYFALGGMVMGLFSLWLLLKLDSRYFLDMPNRKIIYRFSFFVKLHESTLASFNNVSSIELDATEVGRTAAGSWQYFLVVVKKDLSRTPITSTTYSDAGLPEMGKLIADAIKCPYKTGNRSEKMRIMGL